MATVSKLTADVLCADENCDIILRTGTDARVYRQGTFCLDGHERTGILYANDPPDTWLSERLDRFMELFAAHLGQVTDEFGDIGQLQLGQLTKIAGALEKIARMMEENPR